MSFFNRTRRLAKLLAVVIAVGLPVSIVAASVADARVGGRSSVGSRGSKTFSAPPVTNTAPSTAQPMQRTVTQPGTPGAAANTAGATQGAGGMFGRGGMMGGMLGGLAAGFLGAGLFGMLFGGGFLSGLGSFAGFLGLLLQIALVVIVVKLAMSWWRRRNAQHTAYAGMPGNSDPNMQNAQRSAPGGAMGGGLGGGLGSGLGGLFGGGATARLEPVQIVKEDYDAFERLLGQVQHAWSSEDMVTLRRLATPEMAGYLAEDLEANAARGVINKVTDVKLLQGDLAEAWREGDADYATVAMRFGLTDTTTDRASGRIVEGSEEPQEAVELWTFRRDRGGDWVLSAIQQAS